MKITVTDNYETVTLDAPDMATCHEFFEMCQRVALALGYHPDNVRDYFRPTCAPLDPLEDIRPYQEEAEPTTQTVGSDEMEIEFVPFFGVAKSL